MPATEWNGVSPLSAQEEESTKTTSSRAVLAALRALQDKIRRLEEERLAAVDEANEYKRQLVFNKNVTTPDHKKSADEDSYEKLEAENRSLQHRLAVAERIANIGEEESHEAYAARRSREEATARRLTDVEAALENMIAANRLLAIALGGSDLLQHEEHDLVADADTVLTASRAALQRAQTYTKHHGPTKVKKAKTPPTRPPKRMASSSSSAGQSTTRATTARRPSAGIKRKKKTVSHSEKKTVPWLPSSNNDAVSYNLLAACNYALKRGSRQTTTSAHIPHIDRGAPRKKKSPRRPASAPAT